MSKISRRKALGLMGGGALVALAGGAWHVARPVGAALAPWDAAGQYPEARLRALSWAILSPNPHNRQPWLLDLSEPDAAVLYVDTQKLLPHTDPFSRQIVIGLGCFLETLQIAAAQDGLLADISLFPEGSDAEVLDGRPVARITFRPGAEADPDFALLAQRRTQKEPYDLSRPVAASEVDRLVASVRHGTRADGSVDAGDIQTFRALSEAAMQLEIDTPHTYKESVDLFRIGRAEVNANPDGIDFTGPMFEALHLSGQFSRDLALDRDSMAYKGGLDAVLTNMRTAMGHVWINTSGNSRTDQIAAGRDWMRLHLAATRAGIAIQPLSQALQEYPEMATLYADAHRRLAKPGETVQMWARVGYCAEVPASPRWPLEAKILHG
ncbi:MAG: twin-arginine translocation pathway signal protein [Pseudomonadota bacterium]